MAGINKKVYRKKNGQEVTIYTITYRDIHGKQHTSGSYKTLKEARKDLEKYNTKINTSHILTVDEIIDIYIESREKKGRANNTIRNYKYYKSYIKRDFEGVKYNKLTAYKWQNWLYKIADTETVYVAEGCYRLLCAAYKYCRKFKKITENIFIDVEPIDIPKTEHNHFDLDEIKIFLDVCEKQFSRWYVMFFTFIASGGRAGEIYGLKKCYVDFDNDRIEVAGQYTHGEYKNKLKTEKSRRTWYLFPMWKKMLQEHIASDTTGSEFVFHNEEGNPLDASNVRERFWRKLLSACGYPKDYARMHDLRGSNSDLSIALGLSITYTSESLGHYDIETTRKYYNQNNATMIKDATEKYEAFFSSPKNVRKMLEKKEDELPDNVILFPQRLVNKG